MERGEERISLDFKCDWQMICGYIINGYLTGDKRVLELIKAEAGDDIAFLKMFDIPVGYIDVLRAFGKKAVDPNSQNAVSAEQETFFLMKFLASKRFAVIIAAIEKYVEWLKKQWETNGTKLNIYMKEILRIPLGNKTVIIPVMLFDSALMDETSIMWGAMNPLPKGWPHCYALICIMHEYTHMLIGNKAGAARDDISVAVVELAIFHWLRLKFNKPFGNRTIGQIRTALLREKIMPHWEKYCSSEDQNILEFVGAMHELMSSPS